MLYAVSSSSRFLLSGDKYRIILMYLSGEGVLTPSSMYFMFEGGRSTALANSRS